MHCCWPQIDSQADRHADRGGLTPWRAEREGTGEGKRTNAVACVFLPVPTDVITIEKAGDKGRFRLLYDTKGRFVLKKIVAQESEVGPPSPATLAPGLCLRGAAASEGLRQGLPLAAPRAQLKQAACSWRLRAGRLLEAA